MIFLKRRSFLSVEGFEPRIHGFKNHHFF